MKKKQDHENTSTESEESTSKRKRGSKQGDKSQDLDISGIDDPAKQVVGDADISDVSSILSAGSVQKRMRLGSGELDEQAQAEIATLRVKLGEAKKRIKQLELENKTLLERAVKAETKLEDRGGASAATAAAGAVQRTPKLKGSSSVVIGSMEEDALTSGVAKVKYYLTTEMEKTENFRMCSFYSVLFNAPHVTNFIKKMGYSLNESEIKKAIEGAQSCLRTFRHAKCNKVSKQPDSVNSIFESEKFYENPALISTMKTIFGNAANPTLNMYVFSLMAIEGQTQIAQYKTMLERLNQYMKEQKKYPPGLKQEEVTFAQIQDAVLDIIFGPLGAEDMHINNGVAMLESMNKEQ